MTKFDIAAVRARLLNEYNETRIRTGVCNNSVETRVNYIFNEKLALTDLAAACDEIEKLREVLFEIANRASNMLDADAASWLPSIYKIACEATGEDPANLLELARAALGDER